MKRKIAKYLILLVMILFPSYVNAAGLSVSANYSSIVKGGTVTVTVKADGITGKFSITSSDGGVLSGGTSSVWLENETKTYKFSAKSLGSATIKVTPLDVADSSGKVYSTSKSVNIKVVAPREKSTNNNLHSLEVEGYTLSPKFNKDTLNYTVELPSEVEKIKISATKESSYSTVTGTGEKNVKEGENKFEIVVTSETGSKKTYTIIATVKDSSPIIVKVLEEELTVIKRKDVLTKPDGFKDVTIKIGKYDIPAFEKEETNLILVGLKDKEGNIKLYSYDKEKDSYKEYKSITVSKYTFYQKEPTEIPEGFEKTTGEIGDDTYSLYKKENDEDSYLFGEVLEAGLTGWYRYSAKDKTLQYEDVTQEVKVEEEEPENDTDIKDKIIVALSGLSAVLFLTLIIVTATKSKKRKKKKKVKTILDE